MESREKKKIIVVAREREKNGTVDLARGICNTENWDTGLM